MNKRTTERPRPLATETPKTAYGTALLQAVQTEMADMRILLTKRSNRMLVEAILNSPDFGTVKQLTVQLLTNIGKDENPLYSRETNQLSQEAMRLFYNMPATVLCSFDTGFGTLQELQCTPKADAKLSKKEFLVWQLTRRGQDVCTVSDVNQALSDYGYPPLNADEPADRVVLSIFDNDAHAADTRKALCRMLHAENEKTRKREDNIR